MILKMDKYRGNIVVSRKAISDIELKEQRQKLLSNISEGQTLEGKIKNITDYGAFVDLGGIDEVNTPQISHFKHGINGINYTNTDGGILLSF